MTISKIIEGPLISLFRYLSFVPIETQKLHMPILFSKIVFYPELYPNLQPLPSSLFIIEIDVSIDNDE